MEDQQLSQKGARAYVNKALHNLCEEPVDSDYGNMVSEAVAIEAVMIALRATTVPVVGEGKEVTISLSLLRKTMAAQMIKPGQAVTDTGENWVQEHNALIQRLCRQLVHVALTDNNTDSTSPTLEGREEKEEVDYSDPQVQYKLACEAERRLRLRGHISDSAAAIIRVKIQKRLDKDLEKGGQDAS